MIRDGSALARVEPLGDPAHLRMVPASVSIGFKLPLQVTGVQAGKARGSGAVAATVQAVAGEAGICGAGTGAAQGHELAGRGEAVGRGGGDRIAAGQQHDCGNGREGCKVGGHRHRPGATSRPAAQFRSGRLLPTLLLLLLAPIGAAGCKPPPDQRQFTASADAAAGRAEIERVGCAACHDIPGIDWPRGKVGPALAGLSDRALIAGRLPNRPDLLAAFVRDAPALVPGSAMPAMPLTERQSEDIAAYLYERGER
jgi:cytochrome c1